MQVGGRKLLFIDAKKARLNPRCEQDVYVGLPEEAGYGPGICGKLNYWLWFPAGRSSMGEAIFCEACWLWF